MVFNHDDTKRIALQLLKRGIARPTEIAKLAGVSQQVVDNWCHRGGIDWKGARDKRLVRLWRAALKRAEAKPMYRKAAGMKGRGKAKGKSRPPRSLNLTCQACGHSARVVITTAQLRNNFSKCRCTKCGAVGTLGATVSG